MFRGNKKDKLSKYMEWVLVGLSLGYTLCRHSKDKKHFYFITPNGEFKEKLNKIHQHAVNALMSKGYLVCKISNDIKGSQITYSLSPTGFDAAASRLDKSKISLYDKNTP